jgi:hypothetical protein
MGKKVQEWLIVQPKHYILIKYRKLWTAGPNALKIGEIKQKNNAFGNCTLTG